MKKMMLLMLLPLNGCFTMLPSSSKINRISLGMSKEDVIRVMGNPTSTSAMQGVEYLDYSLYASPSDKIYWRSSDYSIQIINGVVTAYGRRGDFGTTQQTKQTMEVIHRDGDR